MGVVLFVALGLRLLGLHWGLPASDGWDDDGVAPRDFLVGVVQTFTPGEYYTYPPAHLLVLTLLTAPIWLVGLVLAPSHAPDALIRYFIAVPYMTAFALVARAVSAVMSVWTIQTVAALARELRIASPLPSDPRGERAEVATAVVLTLHAPLTYYGHTTNLDGPALFWASSALMVLVRMLRGHGHALWRALALRIALAITTKDQAAAIFLYSFPPLVLAWWMSTPRGARAPAVRSALYAAAAAIGLILLIDGALFNPRGFMRRLHFLLGPASQDHAYYAATWDGRRQILLDLWAKWGRAYPAWPFWMCFGVGLTSLVRRRDDTAPKLLSTAVACAPLLAAVSFTIAFSFSARRTEERFMLPQTIFLAVYCGVGAARLWGLTRALLRWPTRAGLAAAGAWGLFAAVAVDVALLKDPRYAVEAWLAAHVKPDQVVETYGNNVYLPRFPPHARVERIDTTPIKGRNPLPNVRERQEPFGAGRTPDVIVVSEFWASRYVYDRPPPPAGYQNQPDWEAKQRDEDARRYFRALVRGESGYQLAFLGTWTSTLWPRVDIHASTTRDIHVYVRRPPP